VPDQCPERFVRSDMDQEKSYSTFEKSGIIRFIGSDFRLKILQNVVIQISVVEPNDLLRFRFRFLLDIT